MMTFKKFEKQFPDETACLDYLVKMRWPDGVCCPRCGNVKVYKIKTPYRWTCKACAKNGYRFSPIAGTIFENTNIKLRVWLQVIFMMTQSKKGISALQLHRMLGTGSYKTAWYMCHRIRASMKNWSIGQLMGEVEVDETYVGGKWKNRHVRERKVRNKGSRTSAGKVAVIGAIARKGNVVCQVIEKADPRTLQRFVDYTVSEKVSLLATDEHYGYQPLRKMGFPHQTVRHVSGEYVRQTVFGSIHTQNLDSFWSLLKRGIVGTFHKVSKDYLPLYLNEFSFRHNNRKNPDMFGAIIAGC